MKQITIGNPHCLVHTYKICHFPRVKNMSMLHPERKMFLEVFMCVMQKCMKSTQGIFQGWLTYDGCSLDILSACDMVI